MPILLDLLTEEVGHLLKTPDPVWKTYNPTEADIGEFEQNSMQNNTFDKLSLKYRVWVEYKKGNYKCVGKECQYGQVVALLPPGERIPTGSWGRIFQWFGKPADRSVWKVFWFGSPVKREFPDHGHELGPAHVNGGYTTPCSTRGIFIYRLEEATRVLIHELMHAACLDPPTDSIPIREAHVETWAELLLVAFRSKGSIKKAESLWRIQAEWIASTNYRAETSHNVLDHTSYAWRYLNGRKHVYEDLGFSLPIKGGEQPAKSTRFTAPILDK